MKLLCPRCGNADQDQFLGHEVRGVYDGVLFWGCTACGWAWSRDWSGYGVRADIAARLVREHIAKGLQAG